MNTPITHASDISVLIVGAGPTGLILACDLARRGVDFRIVEKANEYAAGSRGKGMQPRSLEVLDDVGVIDRILVYGQSHTLLRSYDGTTVLGDHDMHQDRHRTADIPYESTLFIPQWRTEVTLRLRLEELGAQVELATELGGWRTQHCAQVIERGVRRRDLERRAAHDRRSSCGRAGPRPLAHVAET